ncbi:nucleotidyltransferase domain-containing protein [Sulfurospirillum diekertiae]|uniref:Polymerase beta nucleotidyltransferase domain-containing protein n=1 Tax=Sulfurospirillum diekertiae TaxID=1854492 RepID=A0A1Y0HKJ1_9BACT|nr:nucleotidyltransferase domain-containing protein [Sulfurospirillum diekertiae]ARU48582.1 hypothetical protein Sdiek1_1418 [Sulfurospirillum diekertiae]ASC93412.1 hypothetical protein Sdiek2_1393 [Sulfurospirillum diekertiae]
MNKIIYLISTHINIFELFTEVYIFGSIVKNSEFPNDIDLLLVYEEYTKEIENEKNIIDEFLATLFKLEIDITLLSEKELMQTNFLEKISFNYQKLK